MYFIINEKKDKRGKKTRFLKPVAAGDKKLAARKNGEVQNG